MGKSREFLQELECSGYTLTHECTCVAHLSYRLPEQRFLHFESTLSINPLLYSRNLQQFPKFSTQLDMISEDLDKFTNITLLLRLLVLLNQEGPTTHQSGAQAGEVFLGGLADILGVTDEVVTAYVPETATVVVATRSETDLDAVYMAPLGPTCNPIIVPNLTGSRNSQGKDITTNPHQLRLLNANDADDFWPQIKTDEWCCAK